LGVRKSQKKSGLGGGKRIRGMRVKHPFCVQRERRKGMGKGKDEKGVIGTRQQRLEKKPTKETKINNEFLRTWMGKSGFFRKRKWRNKRKGADDGGGTTREPPWSGKPRFHSEKWVWAKETAISRKGLAPHRGVSSRQSGRERETKNVARI